MRINQNIAAFNAYRNLSSTNVVMGKSLEKLSSGFRINRAADDAAGLVISQGLRAQVSGLRQATRNAQDGISVVQTAEGALQEVHAMLNRMRDLAVQASNGSNDEDARAAAQAEIDQLIKEIDRIGETTKFGQIGLLDGTAAATQVPGGAGTPATSGTWSANIGTTFDFGGGALDLSGNALQLSLVVDGDNANPIAITLNGNSYATLDDLGTAIASAIDGQNGVAASYDAGTDSLTVTSDSTGSTSSVALTVTSAGAATNFAFSNVDADPGADEVEPGDATTTGGLTFQVGANSGEVITFGISAVNAQALGVDALDVTEFETAQDAIDAIDEAIKSVSTTRGELGAVQNRFESTINNLQVTTENLAASESRIRDTDMALEMVSFTRHQILLQAGTAMLGQANALPQSVLRLLG